MWVCRTVEAIMQPITEHDIKLYEDEWYETENEVNPVFSFNCTIDQNFSFLYCVAFRNPNLPEWILARWYWNDEWIWTPDWIFPM